jgi:hypothetical protein
MSDNNFDAMSKMAAKAVTRRQTLGGLAAALGGMLLASLGGASAFAATPPRVCATCVCGSGKPCNAKGSTCTEVRGFPDANAACTAACQGAGKAFCGGVTQFHCPAGCP